MYLQGLKLLWVGVIGVHKPIKIVQQPQFFASLCLMIVSVFSCIKISCDERLKFLFNLEGMDILDNGYPILSPLLIRFFSIYFYKNICFQLVLAADWSNIKRSACTDVTRDHVLIADRVNLDITFSNIADSQVRQSIGRCVLIKYWHDVYGMLWIV